MQFFSRMDEEKANYIRRERHKDAVNAHWMQVFVTVAAVILVVMMSLNEGTLSGSSITILFLTAFYWIWYRILPRTTGRWKREKEEEELRFTKLLYKYIDATALEDLLSNLSKRLDELEGKSK